MVDKGELPENLKIELLAWEAILCAQEGMSLQAAFEKPLPKLYVFFFFETNQDKLIAFCRNQT